MNIKKELLSYWRGQSVNLQPAAPSRLIKKFELENSITLPMDFIDYLAVANGFNQHKNHQDVRGFNFWPIEDLRRASEFDLGGWAFDNAESFFIFCDYLDLSWAYAIRVEGIEKGQVLLVGAADGMPQHVAARFSEFISLYISNDPSLYVR